MPHTAPALPTPSVSRNRLQSLLSSTPPNRLHPTQSPAVSRTSPLLHPRGGRTHLQAALPHAHVGLERAGACVVVHVVKTDGQGEGVTVQGWGLRVNHNLACRQQACCGEGTGVMRGEGAHACVRMSWGEAAAVCSGVHPEPGRAANSVAAWRHVPEVTATACPLSTASGGCAWPTSALGCCASMHCRYGRSLPVVLVRLMLHPSGAGHQK